jgi:aerobic carbon-monoxide dehydrogenase medium subunit
VIQHRFNYVAPDSLAGCVAALAADGGGTGARVLAGGTWVLPEMSRAESRPARLVDLRRAGLGGVTATPDGLSVGAMCTYAELLASPDVLRDAPLLATMAGGITGGWALRSQATVGGSAVSARPQSDVPGALVACGAVARAVGPEGERRFPVAELFTDAMRSSLLPGEVLAGFDVPSAADAGHGYVKLKRGGSSWPIATAAALVRLDGDGVCREVSLVLGAVTATPLRVDVAAALVGVAPGDDDLREAAQLAGAAVEDPWDDLLAPGSYRAAVAAPIARRALTMAVVAARTTQEAHA